MNHRAWCSLVAFGVLTLIHGTSFADTESERNTLREFMEQLEWCWDKGEVDKDASAASVARSDGPTRRTNLNPVLALTAFSESSLIVRSNDRAQHGDRDLKKS
jgi:hypothetical protein